MHVVQISFFVDPARRSPETLLNEWQALSDIAGSVASAGAEVTVIQANTVAGRIERNGVSYRFLVPDGAGSLLAGSRALGELLAELRPDVFHVHGMCFPRETIELHRLAPQVPILLQDHAEKMPRLWRRRAWRRGVAAASGISFCAREQAEPFVAAGLIESQIEIFEIPESTSSFTPGDAAAARAETGIGGNPAVLWVGHLNSNKDPLTVLEGVSAAARELPSLRLWLCYGTAPLLSAVKTRIASDPALRDRVHLIGRVPHERVELLMRAADLFVLGSHREGSSFSLIEALATGLEPVVTDIPSLRALTSGGRVGELWPCGDAASLTAALLRAARRPREETRASVLRHFEATLSPLALGRRLLAAYERLLSTRRAESSHSDLAATGGSA